MKRIYFFSIVCISLNLFANVGPIKQKYNITDANSCQIAVSKTIKDPTEGKDLSYKANHQLACMVAGYKDVYHSTFDTLKEELKNIDPLIMPELKKQGVKYISFAFPADERVKTGIYFYTPKGEKNALLLSWLDIQEYAGGAFTTNP